MILMVKKSVKKHEPDMDNQRNPLEGLKIIDITDEKGVFCTKLLADLGAGVIKVEKPDGDSSRAIGPFLNNERHPEKSLFFAYNNTNKKSITLNLEMPRGREIFRHLVASSDAIVETYHPGYLESIGLNYSSLNKINPGLVMASITGFGQNGSYSNYNAPDIVTFAMGGLMYITGESEMPPLMAGGLQTYYLASLFAAIATLIALHARDETGKGQQVDVSIQECVAAVQEFSCYYFYSGQILKRLGAQHHHAVPSNIYPCKDGYWSICVGPSSRFWANLIAWIISDGINVGECAEYEDYGRRWADLDTKINPLLSKWGMLHTKAEIFELGQRNDIPVAPVNNAKDVFEDRQLIARGFFEEITHPVIGQAKYPGLPWVSNKKFVRHNPAPLIGQHNDEIYKELGLSQKDLLNLKKAGVI